MSEISKELDILENLKKNINALICDPEIQNKKGKDRSNYLYSKLKPKIQEGNITTADIDRFIASQTLPDYQVSWSLKLIDLELQLQAVQEDYRKTFNDQNHSKEITKLLEDIKMLNEMTEIQKRWLFDPASRNGTTNAYFKDWNDLG